LTSAAEELRAAVTNRAESATVSAAFMLLVDTRIPTGGYAHSGGIEAAVSDGRVVDLPTLAAYLDGRLGSSGLNDAALAVAAHARIADAAALSDEAAARCPSPALRAASRAEAKGLLRAARAMWPSPELNGFVAATEPPGSMWSVALGAVARAAGLSEVQVSTAATYASISGPAFAAVRLLGLDPYRISALLSCMSARVDEVAEQACRWSLSATSLRGLPAVASPLQEIAAEERERWEVRLFVS
jgi:urease accessory protein